VQQAIDCRGLACPQPVLRTKQALGEISTGSIIVIVDNEAAKGNVTRFAENQGCKVSVEEKEGVFYLAIEKKEESKATGTMPPEFFICQPGQQKMHSKKETILVFKSDQMGTGDAALGKILIQALLKTLSSVDEKPNKLIFYNRGVYLTTDDSEVLPALEDLAATGMGILVCGTCLDHYHLKEKLAVGTISNMFSILETMAKADKVIFP